MESYRPLPGTPIQELDTPCLLVDLDALEHNYGVIAEAYREASCKMRQHIKDVKSPMLAQMQIRAGGTMGGVCAAKVSEAEVMVESGIYDVMLTSQVATWDKMARLCSVAKRADVKVAIDDGDNLRQWSEVAVEHGVTVGVVIEVDTSMGRGGVRRAEQGVELARLATELTGIAFKGVMSHQGLPGQTPDRETRWIEGRRYIQMCLDVRDAIEAAGIPVEIVSTGESWTYDVAAAIPSVTEVQGGTYALMSNHYTYMDEFEVAAKVLGTVVSTPRPKVAVGDVGIRAIGLFLGVMPSLEGLPGIAVEALQEEHILLRSEGPMSLALGDKFILHTGHQDTVVNRWDQFIAVRDGRVEAVWDVGARGCHH